MSKPFLVEAALEIEPAPLPFCPYPRAADVASHGVQPLPHALPLVDLFGSRRFRSQRYTAVPASALSNPQVLQLAQVVADAFARREPQSRYLRPAARPPASVQAATHEDPFGRERFGPWTRERLLYWFIRLCVLTNPTSPRSAVTINRDVLSQSLAILDDRGEVIGGALNETMPPADAAPAMRTDDPFLSAAWGFVGPILEMLLEQDDEALGALCGAYPAFRDAYEAGRVGHHFMVARSDALPKADAFELVAASATHYRWLGFEYMLVEATNQWTGAACEALAGVRVHFSPFRRRRLLAAGYVRPDETTTMDGYLSDKDSGSMFYVIRLI
jgi:hypothetical protein